MKYEAKHKGEGYTLTAIIDGPEGPVDEFTFEAEDPDHGLMMLLEDIDAYRERWYQNKPFKGDTYALICEFLSFNCDVEPY